jgi:hypothetical protein
MSYQLSNLIKLDSRRAAQLRLMHYLGMTSIQWSLHTRILLTNYESNWCFDKNLCNKQLSLLKIHFLLPTCFRTFRVGQMCPSCKSVRIHFFTLNSLTKLGKKTRSHSSSIYPIITSQNLENHRIAPVIILA